MRLLFLSNILPSPLHPTKGVFNRGLVRALTRAGHEVSAIAPVAWTDWIRASHAQRRELRHTAELVNDVPIAYPVYFYTPGILRSAYGHFMWYGVRNTVLKLMARQRPQAIVADWVHPDGFCAIQAGRFAGIPSIVMTGGSDVLLLTATPSRRRVIYRVLNAADAVVTVSCDIKQKVVANEVDSQKVHVVRRGIDYEHFYPGSRQDARRRVRLPSDHLILLWAGRMESVKGLPVLLDAIDRLRVDAIDITTVLVGSGTEAGLISAEIKRRRLSQKVIMTGAVTHTNLADYYRAANLVVLPSLSEGVPNVLLESIACGTPFVASQVGGIPEIASPGIDLLVPAGQPKALALAIRDKLLGPPPTVPRSFVPDDWPTAASRLIDVIQPLVEQYRCRPGRAISHA